MKNTYHSVDRAKERLSFNSDTLERLSKKALIDGIKHSEANERLRKYFDSLFLERRTANNIRIYGENVYLFHDETLITVFQVPVNLRKIVIKVKHRKEN
jgi:hypothetical protein